MRGLGGGVFNGKSDICKVPPFIGSFRKPVWLPTVCQALFPEAEAAVGSLPPAPKLLPAGQGAPTINLNFIQCLCITRNIKGGRATDLLGLFIPPFLPPKPSRPCFCVPYLKAHCPHLQTRKNNNDKRNEEAHGVVRIK